jgi:hypothetical protein
MRTLFRVLLKVISITSWAASMGVFLLWLLLFMVMAPNSIKPQLDIEPMLLILGGLIGWVALFGLVILEGRPLRKLPKWVLFGVVIGVVDALALGATFGIYGIFFAVPPIMTAIFSLAHSFIARPDIQKQARQ